MIEAKWIVNRQDQRRLMEVIRSARRSWITYAPALDWLAGQLERSVARDAAEVPPDVVTMNSRVELKDLRTGDSRQVTLVYPGEANGEDAVSVFAPVGLAIIGSRVGDIVGWPEADRSRAAWLGKLCYQPEAAGDHDL